MAAIAYPELDTPVGARPAPSHLRLVPAPPPRRRVAAVHRRRRLAVVLAAVVLAGVSWGLLSTSGSPSAAPAAPAASPAPIAAVVVAQPGDTFWSIAVAMGGDSDVRARVDALVAANGGAPLRAGDRVVLPG